MDEAYEIQTTVVEPSPKKSVQPKKWWQWLIIYPGFTIALLGSVPTYLDIARSYMLDVPYKRVFEAKQQNQLWQDNFDCMQEARFTSIKNKYEVEIGSTVCPSGDVLIMGKRPEWDDPRYRWVPLDEVVSESEATGASAIFGFWSTAYAAEGTNYLLAKSVLCQRWVGEGLLLQRVTTSSGCYDQVINTYNGQVVQNTPAPCNSSC